MVELALAAKSQEKAAALVYFTMGDAWRARSRQTVQVLTCALLKHALVQAEIRLLAKS